MSYHEPGTTACPTCLSQQQARKPSSQDQDQDRVQITWATRNYERGVDLVAIQQMLGHRHVGTTMRYVSPSATFIEDAYRRAVSGTLANLGGQADAD
jgi:integrase/recombinase XerD